MPLPYVGTFAETDVRLYSVGDAGRHGVLFRSLRAAEIVELDDELVAAAGVRFAGERLRALFSPGVHARFGRPSRVT